MIDWNAITPHLTAKLDPKHVTKRVQSGRTLDYIEGWFAISEANRIFGFGEWTRETVEMREVRAPEQVNGNWRVGFISKVRVTAGGITRDGHGYGSGISKDLGDAYESAVKEAETDAMKRALMTFGNPFGLALYDKSRANVGVGTPRQETPHDPETGEVRDERNPPPPSPEIEKEKDPPSVTDFINQVRERLAMSGVMEPTREQLEHGYGMAVIENIADRKPSRRAKTWFEIFTDLHGNAIGRIKDEDLRKQVRSAIALKQAQIAGGKPDPADYGFPFGNEPIVLGEQPVIQAPF